MSNNPTPPKIIDGRFIDTGTGLIVPQTYAGHSTLRPGTMTSLESKLNLEVGFNHGEKLRRDADTLVVKWAAKGSGLDDIANAAIVEGRIANVGVAPVIAPQISAMVRRQQDQAATASVEIMGRATPVNKARDAISRFNDSPLGINDALKTIVYNMRTFNRGCPIATVPITYDMTVWESYGMEAVPIDGADDNHFYLTVDWSRMGTPIPYIPNPLNLEATGNTDWPYWYLAMCDGKPSWVLLHSSQIMPLLPGKTTRPGIGTSSVWICLGYLAESILVVDERIEKMVNALADGLVIFGGLPYNADFLKDAIQRGAEENRNIGNIIHKGHTLITTPEQPSLVQVSFRQPNGVTFTEQREYEEDVIAFAFSEPLSAMVTRGGVGYGAQAETTADNSADTGVGSILKEVGLVLGAIYPRTQIAISRPNDRAKRLNLDSFKTLTEAISRLPDGTLTPDEIRGIIERDIMDIPESGEDDITVSANSDDDDSPMMNSRHAFAVLTQNDELTITDEDVDLALDRALTRIDNQLYEMLNAEAVES